MYVKSQLPLLLLKIEEDNNENKSRAKIHQKEMSLSKASSKTEFPELRKTTFKSRLKNNQSINLSRVQ